MLAEQGGCPPWGLPATVTIEWLRCETEQPVDYLLAGTSDDGLIFAQIKHTLTLSERAESSLAAALDQFVRQFVASGAHASGGRPWECPLESVRDRLVLMTGRGSSAPIRESLSTVLTRLRALLPSLPFADAAGNSAERRALSIVVNHIKRSWQAVLEYRLQMTRSGAFWC